MKKSILIFLFMGLISCNSQEKKETSFVNVNVEEFQKLISTKGAQLIDVRTLGEYNSGHLKNALLIDYMSSDFKSKAFKGIDKSKPVLLYCASGGRSAKSAKMYKEAGFKKVYNLVGGFRAWKAKNLEIEK
ncbi:MAG: rhodanese-like domain-containing protein [Polaribacter sp.]|jgi:rhodanese-related sulfurtransferase|nr:rhodanese-like domain-containing protein [Polaribacter sp.]MDG1954553.1 rhodanese-like domain-containing protein [Polaribacter sp.]MDG2073452.1 rhodanese-like domain-containing protein [Polaribacter sp.]